MRLRFRIFVAPRSCDRVGLVAAGSTGRADDLPIVTDVEFQPLSAQAKRIARALDLLGQPLSRAEKTAARQGHRFHRRAACDPGRSRRFSTPTAWSGSKSTPRAASSRPRARPCLASFRTAGPSSWSRSTTRPA